MTDEHHNTHEIVSLIVPSHPRYLYVIRSAMYPILIDAGFGKKDTRRIILALDEACSNIIKYAYEGDASKSIFLKVAIGPGELQIELRDTGKKAEPATIVPRDLADVRPGGLGTHFMNEVFDAVRYDTSMREGTLLTLVKKRPSLQNEVRA